MNAYTITISRFFKSAGRVIERTVTTDRRGAILACARLSDPQKALTAPRGQKGSVLEAARCVKAASGRISGGHYEQNDPLTTPISTRLDNHKRSIGDAEIFARGLSTPAGWDDFHHRVIPASADEPRGHWLISGEGWFKYSSRVGSYHQSATYLIGIDEDQRFAVRVPANVASVSEALEWLKPSAIREAEEKGIPVKRQGDIFFRPMKIREHDMSAIRWTRHEARARKDGGLTIIHPEHKAIVLSGKYTWRAYASTQISSSGRAAAD